MKALSFDKYGSPLNVLDVRDVKKPSPAANEVLIRVHYTTINDYDWSMVRGRPWIYRLMFGLFRPNRNIPGMELSGIVEQVGSEVKAFKKGDAVLGDISDHGFGTFAEYIAIHENAVIQKPESISFEEAAAIPHAALLAYQAFHDIGQIRTGMKVLINGGGGGVGTLGLQLAKQYQCEVTGVDHTSKQEMMKSIGFDEVLDYRKTNFTKTGAQYDLILDCKTSQSIFDYKRALTPSGKYISIGGNLWRLIKMMFLKNFISTGSSKSFHLLALKANQGLEQFHKRYVDSGMECKIEGPYPLEDAPRMLQYFGEGKHKGKVVISLL